MRWDRECAMLIDPRVLSHHIKSLIAYQIQLDYAIYKISLIFDVGFTNSAKLSCLRKYHNLKTYSRPT